MKEGRKVEEGEAGKENEGKKAKDHAHELQQPRCSKCAPIWIGVYTA